MLHSWLGTCASGFGVPTPDGAWNMGWIILDASGEVLRAHQGLDYAYILRGEVGDPDLADALIYTSNGTPLSFEI